MKYCFLIFLFIIFSQTTFSQNAPLYTKKNAPVYLDTLHVKYLVLLKNNRYCFNCFEELKPLFDSIKKAKIVDSIIAIILTDSCIFSTYEISSLENSIDGVLFDYTAKRTEFIAQKSKENSLFSQFQVYSSPALLLIRPGEKKYFSTEELYNSKSIDPNLFSKVNIFFK